MNYVMNKLPSTTWNKLRMNEARVTVEEELVNHSPVVSWEKTGAAVEKKDPAAWEMVSAQGDLGELTKMAEVVSVTAEDGLKMDAPVVLTYDYGTGEQGASRLSLIAGENSHLKVIAVLTSPMKSRVTSALQTKICAKANAVVDFYVIQLLGDETLCLNAVEGCEAPGAKIRLLKLELGGFHTYAGANMDLRGTESSFVNEIGYHVKSGQTLDMNYVAVHTGKRTNCEMQVNGTLEEGAKKVFRGTIDFRQGCAGAKAAENENVLLMGEDLQNQTLPVILCREEDVEGNHGASIGQLDEKILFYLATRGISREAAQAMIAQARIDAICEKIPVEAIRDQVREFEKVRGISHGEEL